MNSSLQDIEVVVYTFFEEEKLWQLSFFLQLFVENILQSHFQKTCFDNQCTYLKTIGRCKRRSLGHCNKDLTDIIFIMFDQYYLLHLQDVHDIFKIHSTFWWELFLHSFGELLLHFHLRLPTSEKFWFEGFDYIIKLFHLPLMLSPLHC